MAPRLIGRLQFVARRRRLWAPAALLLVAVLYLGWCGGSALWVRSEWARAERAIAEYDFAEGRRSLDRCLSVRPNDPDLRLLAARTARRDGDLEAARRHLDAYRVAVRESSPAITLERADMLRDDHVEAVLRIGAASFNWPPEQIPEWRVNLRDHAHDPQARESEIDYLAYLDGYLELRDLFFVVRERMRKVWDISDSHDDLQGTGWILITIAQSLAASPCEHGRVLLGKVRKKPLPRERYSV